LKRTGSVRTETVSISRTSGFWDPVSGGGGALEKKAKTHEKSEEGVRTKGGNSQRANMKGHNYISEPIVAAINQQT